MTNKERENLKNNASKAGAKTSAYDPNVQFLNGFKIIHTGTNRTKVGTVTYYGDSAANTAINKAK